MNLLVIAARVASRRLAASSPKAVTWDEISMEWSDQGSVQIQGQFSDLVSSQKAIIEVNKVLEENARGEPFGENEEVPWVEIHKTSS